MYVSRASTTHHAAELCRADLLPACHVSHHMSNSCAARSLQPAVTPCRFVRQGRPEQGLPLFQAECLKWPGFVEFDDVNCKILTYSAVNRCAAADGS